MSGLFFGSVLFGNLADRCGRRIALMAAVFMASTFQLLGAFMPEYYSYTASRFFAAMGKSELDFLLCWHRPQSLKFRLHFKGVNDIFCFRCCRICNVVLLFMLRGCQSKVCHSRRNRYSGLLHHWRNFDGTNCYGRSKKLENFAHRFGSTILCPPFDLFRPSREPKMVDSSKTLSTSKVYDSKSCKNQWGTIIVLQTFC